MADVEWEHFAKLYNSIRKKTMRQEHRIFLDEIHSNLPFFGAVLKQFITAREKELAKVPFAHLDKNAIQNSIDYATSVIKIVEEGFWARHIPHLIKETEGL